jgi:hypothetical protein
MSVRKRLIKPQPDEVIHEQAISWKQIVRLSFVVSAEKAGVIGSKGISAMEESVEF